MQTEESIFAQCLQLINEYYPNMPKEWRRLTARKAARKWVNDHTEPPTATEKVLDQRRITVRYADSRRQAQAMVDAQLPHVPRRERRKLAKQATRQWMKEERRIAVGG